jgi:hypothetical protein
MFDHGKDMGDTINYLVMGITVRAEEGPAQYVIIDLFVDLAHKVLFPWKTGGTNQKRDDGMFHGLSSKAAGCRPLKRPG